jgi:hypothetical protein
MDAPVSRKPIGLCWPTDYSAVFSQYEWENPSKTSFSFNTVFQIRSCWEQNNRNSEQQNSLIVHNEVIFFFTKIKIWRWSDMKNCELYTEDMMYYAPQSFGLQVNDATMVNLPFLLSFHFSVQWVLFLSIFICAIDSLVGIWVRNISFMARLRRKQLGYF